MEYLPLPTEIGEMEDLFTYTILLLLYMLHYHTDMLCDLCDPNLSPLVPLTFYIYSCLQDLRRALSYNDTARTFR